MKLKYGPYSPSRLDTGICPFAFNNLYINPDPNFVKQENLPQARGSVVHEIFEEITKSFIQRKNFTKEDIRKLVQNAIIKHPAAYQETDEIIKMVELYLQKPPKDLVTDAGIEMKLAVKFTGDFYEDDKTFQDRKVSRPVFTECDYNDPEAFARGRADIMMISDDTTYAVIYDHKTQQNITTADTFQMGFYAWVISKIYPYLDEIHTVLHFARFGMYSERYVWTREELWAIEDQILTRIGVLENNLDWSTAIVHDKCQYCPFIANVTCPVVRNTLNIDENGMSRVDFRSVKTITSQTEAVKVASEIVTLEQYVSGLKTKLKEWVLFSGPVALMGLIFQQKVEEKLDIKKLNANPELLEQFENICIEHGISPSMYKEISDARLKNAWMSEDQVFLQKLSGLIPRKITKRFDSFKA